MRNRAGSIGERPCPCCTLDAFRRSMAFARCSAPQLPASGQGAADTATLHAHPHPILGYFGTIDYWILLAYCLGPVRHGPPTILNVSRIGSSQIHLGCQVKPKCKSRQVLLVAKADPFARNVRGLTALEVAKHSRQRHCHEQRRPGT